MEKKIPQKKYFKKKSSQNTRFVSRGMLAPPPPKRIKSGTRKESDERACGDKRIEHISKAALSVLQVHSDLREMRKAVGFKVDFMPLCFKNTYTGPFYKMNMCRSMSPCTSFPPPIDSFSGNEANK